jgi:hypothetical protein
MVLTAGFNQGRKKDINRPQLLRYFEQNASRVRGRKAINLKKV